jgi:hypothetical protein
MACNGHLTGMEYCVILCCVCVCVLSCCFEPTNRIESNGRLYEIVRVITHVLFFCPIVNSV